MKTINVSQATTTAPLADIYTPLSNAVDYKFKEGEKEKYTEMVLYLIKNGADHKKYLQRKNGACHALGSLAHAIARFKSES